jgi:hypothetical protein
MLYGNVHWNFLAKHIKSISLTVPAKALFDYATCLCRILFLLYLCEKLWSSDGKEGAYIDQRRADL